jgi:hypothetical protein
MPISNLTVTHEAATPKLKMQAKPETVDSVAPRAQTPHYFLWTCFQPFDEPPTVTLAFTGEPLPPQSPFQAEGRLPALGLGLDPLGRADEGGDNP